VYVWVLLCVDVLVICVLVYPFSLHVVTFTFITNSCAQLKHFHNFHLKLYTLKMFAMLTKTNLTLR